jgi:diguanylate cyclase (GGDEF)-like protein
VEQQGEGAGEERALFLSTAPAGYRDRQIALTVVLASLIAFLASVPFAKVQLPPVMGFIPAYQSVLVISDLVTAVLLFGQFSILRFRALLVLASAYLFTACMAVSHTLTFPGLFSPTGLLGAGPQTTAWLYMFWHGGFPLLVIVYARTNAWGPSAKSSGTFDRLSIPISVATVLLASCGLTLLATAGQDALPPVMQSHHYASAMTIVVSCVLGLSILAVVVVWRRRPLAVLDLWLVVVMCAWSLDIALCAVLNGGRFDLGFYAGRIYGLLAMSFVLVMLLLESNRLYALLVETHRSERRKAAELRRLSTLDPLTRIANRRAFEESINEEWRRCMRHRTPLCLLMIDVDCFKRFNDRYGHVGGDQCLRAIASVLAANARRAGELAARYGGEEFAVVLPHANIEDAYHLAQHICQQVRDLNIPHEDSLAASHVTISVGLASALAFAGDDAASHRIASAGLGPQVLIESADQALYEAKGAGRNRVALARADAVPAQSAA